MQKEGLLSETTLLELKRLSNCFGGEFAAQKESLLKTCSKASFRSAKQLISYHDCLLFLSAYPETENLYRLVTDELQRISGIVKKIMSGVNRTKRQQLDRSGLSFTNTQGAFSLDLTRWLILQFPDQIALHSIDDSGVHPQQVLKNTLAALEFDLASEESLKPLKWLEKAAGTKNKKTLLKWIVSQFDKIPGELQLNATLFESLKLYIEFIPADPGFSRTFGRSIPHPVFFHNTSLIKKFDHDALLNTIIPKKKKLTLAEEEHILAASRIALALLNRETDPITYCKPGQLEYYELERGLSIALFSINPDRRLPLESYIGYMMFKNTQPMAYGGCWIYGPRALVGVNIFEPFRGGESAYVFCNIMRVYRQRFKLNYFEVEPYQFGKGNPEGIASGAFWFYYRLGFKPLDVSLAVLAEQEQQKINADKTYRSPFTTLRAFTKSNIALHLSNAPTPVNPLSISKTVTEYIIHTYKGDRVLAETLACKQALRLLNISSQKGWLPEEKQSFQTHSLWLLTHIDLDTCSNQKKQKLSELLRLKGSDEFAYIDLFQQIITV